jgi:hypothetical protein
VDNSLVPDPERIIEGFNQEFVELSEAAQVFAHQQSEAAPMTELEVEIQ